MSRVPRRTELDDRRTNERSQTNRELLITWHHEPCQGVRYRLVNESPGGCLIISSVPLVESMTGTVLGRLPQTGHRMASVVVAWSRPVDDDWHVGLRYLD